MPSHTSLVNPFLKLLLVTAGFPLTDAQVSTSYTVLTAHAPDDVDWAKFAGLDTLVLLMAARNLQLIMQRLLDTGWLPETPVSMSAAVDLPRLRLLPKNVERYRCTGQAIPALLHVTSNNLPVSLVGALLMSGATPWFACYQWSLHRSCSRIWSSMCCIYDAWQNIAFSICDTQLMKYGK